MSKRKDRPRSGEALTIAEAATKIDCHYRTVQRALKQNEFPNAYTIGEGTHVRIPKADVDAYLERQKKRRRAGRRPPEE